ncbi:hypothetical protein FRC07_007294 [Ceratobasidium sp. 392]|nr:hypothetical protein FRC07_007294 [Ceratobasidium sp. 392]
MIPATHCAGQKRPYPPLDEEQDCSNLPHCSNPLPSMEAVSAPLLSPVRQDDPTALGAAQHRNIGRPVDVEISIWDQLAANYSLEDGPFASSRPVKRPRQTESETNGIEQQYSNLPSDCPPSYEDHGADLAQFCPSNFSSAAMDFKLETSTAAGPPFFDESLIGDRKPQLVISGPQKLTDEFSPSPNFSLIYALGSSPSSAPSPSHSYDGRVDKGVVERLKNELLVRELERKDQIIASPMRQIESGTQSMSNGSDGRSRTPPWDDVELNAVPRLPTASAPSERRIPAQIVVDGIIKPAEVHVLFKMRFFENLNPSLAILDPSMHVPDFVLSRSPFLFTAICAISSRYYRERPQLYSVAMHFAAQSAIEACINGQKAVEVVQAYILMSAYPVPAHLSEEDRTQMYLGFAIRMAIDLNLNKPLLETPKDEKHDREILNRTRTWFICFNMARSSATQFGQPLDVEENDVIRKSYDWYKSSKHNISMDIHLTAYVRLRCIVGRFLTNVALDHPTPNKNFDLSSMTTLADEELMALEREVQENFELGSDHSDSACEYRCNLFPLLLNHSRLIMFSFGYQQALLHGLKHSKLFSKKCFEAASKVVGVVVQVLAPSGWLMYALDEHFVFISFAAAFLLRMLQPPFAAALEPIQPNGIIPLVTHLTEVLASDKVAIDDQHSPRLYSRFLSGLIAKQSWMDKFLLPGFNANLSDSVGNPQVDVRQWYIMNRGAIFPGVGTDRWVIDVGREVQGMIQAPGLTSGPNPTSTATSLQVQPKSVNPTCGASFVPSVMNSFITRFMDISQFVACLSQQGCANITDQLDQISCSEFPISNGGFGDIYRGKLKNGAQIAIKTLRIHVNCVNDDQKSLKHAARELYTWSKCRHRNVQRLLGLVEFRDRIGMVSVWETSGNLSEYLQRQLEVDRVQLSIQIAEGLSYIHDVHIIHGDLKASNVFISGDGIPLLTDFGNAALQEYTLKFTSTSTSCAVSSRWAAPELLDGRAAYSAAADVYALGMTILETITGDVPWFGTIEVAVMTAVLMKKEHPKRPLESIPSDCEHGELLWSLLKQCWAYDPENRPTATEVWRVVSTNIINSFKVIN